MITADELVKALAYWFRANAVRESIWSTPHPQWTVDAHAILDFCAERTGISKTQIGAWVDEAADKEQHAA